MPLTWANRISESTATTGTGSLTLGGATSPAFFTFSGIGNGNTCKYTIVDSSNTICEVGQGTYSSSGNTLSRDSVETSTNGNALVNLPAGTKTVFLDITASWLTSIPNANLANSSVTVTAGSGLGGGGTVSLGGAVTLTANVVSVAGRTGAVTLTNADISGLGSAALQPSSAFDAAGSAASALASAEAYTVSQLAAFAGSANITTLGTITSGAWNGTPIANGNLAHSSLTVTAGTGLTGGGAISLGSSGTVSLDLTRANIWTAVQTVNLNAASVPTPSTGTGIELVGTDATIARVETTAFGANAAVTLRRADGTGAAPTALTTSDVIGALNWHGYYASGWSNSQISIEGLATQAWTSAHMGTQLAFFTTPNNSTTLTQALLLDQDQSATFAGAIKLASGNVLSWNSDLGIFRLGAASLAIGNGTNGDFSGSLKLATLTCSSLSVSSGTSTFNQVSIADNHGYYWSTHGSIFSPSDGVIAFRKQDGTSNSSITAGADNITTTSTDAAVWQNSTLSTVSVQVQQSPRQHFISHAWNTTATAADNFVEFINELRPVAGATPTGNLVWSSRISAAGSGSFTDVMTLTTGGTLTATGDLNIHTGGAGTIRLGSNATTYIANLTSNVSLDYSSGSSSGAHVFTVNSVEQIRFNSTGLVASKTFSQYNAIATAGLGVPAIYGLDNRTGLTAADGAATTLYTSTAANQVYRVSADIFATAAVTGTANYTLTWTENSTTQTSTVSATAINVLGTQTNLIRPDNGTAITAQLLGTFTGTFSVIGTVERIA